MLSVQVLQSCRRKGGGQGSVVGAQGTFGKTVIAQSCSISSETIVNYRKTVSIPFQRSQHLIASLTWTPLKTKSAQYARLVWGDLQQTPLSEISRKARSPWTRFLHRAKEQELPSWAEGMQGQKPQAAGWASWLSHRTQVYGGAAKSCCADWLC